MRIKSGKKIMRPAKKGTLATACHSLNPQEINANAMILSICSQPEIAKI